MLLTPSEGYRARVSVISMIGLSSDEQRQSFVNQLQMALFAWIKRNPPGARPLRGLLAMDDEADDRSCKGIHGVHAQHAGVVITGAQVRPRIGFRDPGPEGPSQPDPRERDHPVLRSAQRTCADLLGAGNGPCEGRF